MHGKPSKWLHEISISKHVHTHFSLVLMARAEIWGHNNFPISPTLGCDYNLNSSGIMGIYFLIKTFDGGLAKNHTHNN